jgi:hypothetical protein
MNLWECETLFAGTHFETTSPVSALLFPGPCTIQTR